MLRAVEETLRVETERKQGLETGGVLVGFVDQHLNAIVITEASEPGPRARHGPTTFNRDRKHCQTFLDKCAAASGGIVDFVGEWHKHPEPNPSPSPIDVNTYRRLARDPAANAPCPVVLIVGVERTVRRLARERYTKTNGFIFTRSGFVTQEIQWLTTAAYTDLLVAGSEPTANPGVATPSAITPEVGDVV